MLNIPARIIDPHSAYFGAIVRIIAVQRNFDNRVTSYLCIYAGREFELTPPDVQRHYRRKVTTQTELFHE